MTKLKRNPPTVSVIIPNYNGRDFIRECLDSVLASSYPRLEILVVDNDSKDKSIDLLRKNFGNEKRLKLISLKKNLGPARARNIAAYKSLGKYLVFLDCDTIVNREWLQKSIGFLERNPRIGGGQLKILRLDKKDTYDSAGEKMTSLGFLAERAQGAKDTGQFDKIEDIFSGKTAAMIVKKSVFLKAGGFDDDYFIYWEEPDLCWRIWKLGYRVVFLPMGCIWHAYGTKEKRISKAWANQITYLGCRNQFVTIVKNGIGLLGIRMTIGVLGAWVVLFFLFLTRLSFNRAWAILSAFRWLFKNRKALMGKRAKLKERLGSSFASDGDWFYKIEGKRGIGWYFGKGRSYLLGKPY